MHIHVTASLINRIYRRYAVVQIRFVNGFPQSRELIYIIQFYMSPMSIEDLDILPVITCIHKEVLTLIGEEYAVIVLFLCQFILAPYLRECLHKQFPCSFCLFHNVLSLLC